MRKEKRRKRHLSVGGVLSAAFFIGLGIWISGINRQSAERYEMLTTRCTSQTDGTVTKINVKETEHEDEDGYTYTDEKYIYTVTFLVNNEPYTATGKCGIRRYDMDEVLAVCYAPEEPETNYIKAFMTEEDQQSDQEFLSMLGKGCIGFGILMLFII